MHVLPAREECVEALQWLAQEVEQAKGEALLLLVERFEGLTDADLIELFQAARERDYAALTSQAAALERSLRTQGKRLPADRGRGHKLLARLRGQHAEIARVDFFECPAGTQLAARLARIAETLAPGRIVEATIPSASIGAYRNKRWVTRPHPHVDRLACAWLIRRFINGRAQIRYSNAPASGEVAFDIGGAQFGHRGNLCTFETMVKAFRLDDPGVRAIAEIVHEIDLRDGRHTRPEIPGVDAILKGWSTYTDPERESHGIALFDGLHTSLSQTLHGVPLKRRR